MKLLVYFISFTAGTISCVVCRARLYTYTFTRWGSGPWWTRVLDREYLPALSLKDGLDRALRDQGVIGATSVPGRGMVPNLLSAFRDNNG